jgi:lysophospholipase
VWVLHGLGEHSGRYEELALFVSQLGFDVLAPDHPGHGLNRLEGGQARLASFDEMIEACREALRFWVSEGPLARRGLSHTPWHVVGHSMGGLLTLEWIRRGRREDDTVDFAQRAFISAPPLALRMEVPGWKKSLARVAERLAPDITVPNGLGADDLSYDAANVAAYRRDPLVHGNASPRYFQSMNATAAKVLANPQDFEIPLALAVGEDDPIVDPAAVKRFFESLATHKRYLAFPRTKHEIFNDTGRAEVYKALVEWVG